MALHKRYVDLLDAQGALTVFYGAGVGVGAKVWWFWHALEHYPAQGGRVFTPLKQVREEALPGGGRVFHWHGPDGEPGQLRLGPGAALLDGRADFPHRRLAWWVENAGMEAQWTAGPAQTPRVVAGRGYADRVRLSTTPRGAGLRRVCFGRFHTAQGDALILNQVTFKDRVESGAWLIENGQAARRLPLELSGWEESFTIGGQPAQAAALRVLHAGPAIDPSRAGSWLQWQALRLVAGKLHERRAVATLAFAGKTYQGVWEDVHVAP